MSEHLSRPEHQPTYGGLVEEIFTHPYTQSVEHDDRIFGSGTVTVRRYLALDGWNGLPDVINPEQHYGGRLTLSHKHIQRYEFPGRSGEISNQYTLQYAHSTTADGRGADDVLSFDALDPSQLVRDEDDIGRLLRAHVDYQRQEHRPKITVHEQPYELKYRPDIALPPDVYTNNPDTYVRQLIERLQNQSEPSCTLVNESPEIEASRILATIDQLMADRQLEDFGITRDGLDDLVRKNYLQAARNLLKRARADESSESVFTERVGEMLWKAGSQLEALGATDQEIHELDLRITSSNASKALENLKQITLTTPSPDPLAVKMIQEKVNSCKKQIWELCMRMGIDVGDFCEAHGLTLAQYNQMQASYSPTGMRGIARRLGLS